MTPPQTPAPVSKQSRLVLSALRVSLHVMFAFLLGYGAVFALVGSIYETRHAAIGGLTLTLGGLYLWGTVLEKRRGLPRTLTDLIRRPGPTPNQPAPRLGPAHLWLALITTLWLGLMCLDSAFTWVVFPIMFLYLHLLTPAPGVLATTLLCTAAVTLPLLGPAGFGWDHIHQHGIAPGYLIGPTLGALLAIVVSFTYRALSEDSARNYALAEQLRAVQAELATQQYAAGKVAERERLAREIHDTLAQGLSSIVLVSRAAAGSLAAGHPATAAEQIRVIHDSAATNLAEARRFIKDLSSPALDTSLAGALADLAHMTQATAQAAGSTLTCTFILEGHEDEANALPAPTAATLLRVAQGALSNVLAHAQATRAAVTLTLWPTEITLDVFDNGQGFTPHHLKTLGVPSASVPLTEAGTGYGLPSLEARLAQLSGSLEIESSGDGTVLTARLPRTTDPEASHDR
ncbi:sensor histidine kinase [Rothia nasimurium]|uniref:sensor histidine kinase n=1 Tax=Rothia nasimurium TaxID=85336 RepID=UPI003BA2EA2A